MEAARLNFPLPFMSHNILDSPIGYLDLANIDIGVETVFLSCLQPEICVLPV